MGLTYPGILIKSCEMDSCKMLPEIDHRLEVMHLLGGFIITIESDRLYFFIFKLSLQYNGDPVIT